MKTTTLMKKAEFKRVVHMPNSMRPRDSLDGKELMQEGHYLVRWKDGVVTHEDVIIDNWLAYVKREYHGCPFTVPIHDLEVYPI